MRWIDEAAVAGKLSWTGVADAIETGHRGSSSELGDVLLKPPGLGDGDAYLSRSAWVKGLGYATKSVTVVPANPAQRNLPTVQGMMAVFAEADGRLEAMLDSAVVTRWKTAGDSVLGARMLARPDARRLVIVGAGVVASDLVRAYSEVFPGLERIEIWNRTRARADALIADLAAEDLSAHRTDDLPAALAEADIIAAATMSKTPVIAGAHVRPGTHVDLIGAFTPDMREADDDLLRKGRLFVDSRKTTLGHIGELMIPIGAGTISEGDILADYYDLANGAPGRVSEDDITVFKNGGGAHLDLMTAKYIIDAIGA